MAGHSHWKQIKQHKGVADKKRGKLFSKLLAAISAAARTDPNPQFNPRLKTAVETARANQVPNENIERAIKRSAEEENLEEIVIEAYGPGKTQLIVEAVTDNRNRTIAELRHLLQENGAKLADPGSVLWAFEKQDGGWKAKFPQPLPDATQQELKSLVAALTTHDDVQRVITNS